MGIQQAEQIAALLERAPLAGFLALTIVSVVVLFWLLMREKNAHQATVREVVALTTAISAHWERQLETNEEHSDRVRELGELVESLRRLLRSKRLSRLASRAAPDPSEEDPS